MSNQQFLDSNGQPLERRQKYIVTDGKEIVTGTFHGEVDEYTGYPIISTVRGGVAVGPRCTITPAPIAINGAGGHKQERQVAQ